MFTPDTLKSYAAEIIIEEQIHIQNDQLPHNLYNDLKDINKIKNISEKEKYTKKKLEVLERNLHYFRGINTHIIQFTFGTHNLHFNFQNLFF